MAAPLIPHHCISTGLSSVIYGGRNIKDMSLPYSARNFLVATDL
ncbi:MAG: hypothetical protein OXC46_11730 [Thaumarchaeota archaeon]|nr:hypothetical protein [Nitrososphaerota archaeon]